MRAIDVVIATQSVVVGFLWKAKSSSLMNSCILEPKICTSVAWVFVEESLEGLTIEWNRQNPILLKVNAE